MAKRGKRYKRIQERLKEVGESFSIEQAAALIKETASAKFDESIDMDIRLGVDPRHADQMVRGTVTLPHGTGKDVRVLVLASPGKQADATEAGAEHVGLDDYVNKIQNENWFEFDVLIATPDVMGQVGRLGRILGPRGLMPNPKVGTVTPDVVQAIKNAKAGQVQYRIDKAGIVHATIGRASFATPALETNLRTLVDALNRAKPASSKGLYLRKVAVSSTMGIGVRVDLSSFAASN